MPGKMNGKISMKKKPAKANRTNHMRSTFIHVRPVIHFSKVCLFVVHVECTTTANMCMMSGVMDRANASEKERNNHRITETSGTHKSRQL